MKDKKSIEEQVAELTEQQKNTILKVDIISGLIIMLGALPGIILMLINLIAMLDVSHTFEIDDGLLITNFIIMGICFVFVIGVLVFVKIMFPYYSAKKCAFIKKSRKNK